MNVPTVAPLLDPALFPPVLFRRLFVPPVVDFVSNAQPKVRVTLEVDHGVCSLFSDAEWTSFLAKLKVGCVAMSIAAAGADPVATSKADPTAGVVFSQVGPGRRYLIADVQLTGVAVGKTPLHFIAGLSADFTFTPTGKPAVTWTAVKPVGAMGVVVAVVTAP